MYRHILGRTGRASVLLLVALLVVSSGVTHAAIDAYVSDSQIPSHGLFKFDGQTGAVDPGFTAAALFPPIGKYAAATGIIATPQGLAINLAGDGLLYVAMQDGNAIGLKTIQRFDPSTGAFHAPDTIDPANVSNLNGYADPAAPGGLTFGEGSQSPTDLFVAANSGPNTGRVERITTPVESMSTFTVENSGHQLDGAVTPAFRPGQGDLYVTGFTSNEVAKYDGTTGAFISSIPVANAPTGLAFSSDGSRMFVSNATGNAADDRVREYNPDSGALVDDNFIPNQELPNGLAFGPDLNGGGEDLYVVERGGSSGVSVYDGTTGALIQASIYSTVTPVDPIGTPLSSPKYVFFVPEPSTSVLLAMGAMLFLGIRRLRVLRT